MSFGKGSRRHGLAGNVFVVAMLVMGSTASYLSVLIGQSGLGGLFACYLVITAWSTARRRRGETSVFDWVALMFALAFGVLSMMGGIEAARSPTGSLNGVPAGMILFLGSVGLLAAAGDIRMLVRGLSGTERIARHLWRMCFALFIATGSFLGQKRVFPLLGGPKILLLSVIPLVLLIYWLIRVRFKNIYKPKSTSLWGSNPTRE